MVRNVSVTTVVLVGLLVVTGSAVEIQVPGDYATIQAAVDAAEDGDLILVADGTYTGDGNRDIDFDGKKITVRSQNGAVNCTIDSEGSEGDVHRAFVLTGGEDPNLSIIDGFTITNGYLTAPYDWRGRGSGIFCYNGGMTVRNCIFTGNTAANGGTIFGESATITIENCSIIDNTALAAAGIDFRSAKVTVQNCIIEDNVATTYNIGGFAIQDGIGRSRISNCTLRRNTAAGDAGAIMITASDMTISNCVISDNAAGGRGGGLHISECEDVDIVNCTITGNTAGLAKSGGGIVCYNSSNLNLSYCDVSENDGGDYGGAIQANNCNMTIDTCSFINNRVEYHGGAVRFVSGGNNILTNCTFLGNLALYQNGGAVHSFGVDLSMTNCLLTGNQCGWNGGAVYFDNGESVCTNCTWSGNRSNEREWGGIYISNDNPVLTNCIAWNNSGTSGTTQEAQFYSEIGTPEMNYCCIQGWTGGMGGTGNIGSDPDFVDEGYWDDNNTPADLTDDVWVVGSHYLLPGSNAIDNGDNGSLIGVETDLVGRNRILNGTVDMGAYENDPGILDIDKLTVKAGKSREAQKDSFTVSGSLDALEADFLAADYVTLRCGAWGETMSTTAFKQAGKNPKYAFKAPAGGITKMTLDFSQQNFSASGKNLDMTGTATPAPVALLFGDSYYGYLAAVDQGVNDIINGKKSLPIQLLLGVADSLVTAKVKAKQGETDNVDKLTVQGALTVDELVDLRTQGLTIHWGTQQYVLQGENFTAKGTNKYIGKVKPSDGDGSSATVTIDFNKCTFKVTLKNTDMAWQVNPVDFGLEFESFNELESVDF